MSEETRAASVDIIDSTRAAEGRRRERPERTRVSPRRREEDAARDDVIVNENASATVDDDDAREARASRDDEREAMCSPSARASGRTRTRPRVSVERAFDRRASGKRRQAQGIVSVDRELRARRGVRAFVVRMEGGGVGRWGEGARVRDGTRARARGGGGEGDGCERRASSGR